MPPFSCIIPCTPRARPSPLERNPAALILISKQYNGGRGINNTPDNGQMETLAQFKQRAKTEAEKLGHTLSYFVSTKSNVHTAICQTCSKSVFISPAVNVPVWGTALTQACKPQTMTIEAVVEATVEVECEVIEVKVECPKCHTFVVALTQHRGEHMCPDCVNFCIESQKFLDRKRKSGEFPKFEYSVNKTG